MCKEKKKYVVNVTKAYSDCGLVHRSQCTPQATWATSKAQAENNVRHRLGRPLHPITNYYDEFCEWELDAKLV